MEKYMQLSFGDHLVFRDSLLFMPTSLENLTENLKKAGQDKFLQFKKGFQNTTQQQLDLLLRKAVYPYDWVTEFKKFNHPSLPTIQDFHSKLRDKDCSQAEYNHAQEVWRSFDCQTFKDYADLYLKTDVLLLADIFENFRDICITTYWLDPAHYVSAPQLSWDAMLLRTQVELDLISDPEM